MFQDCTEDMPITVVHLPGHIGREEVRLLTVDPMDPRPAYAQIADQLRDAIMGGELADGAQLPSERELIERSGTSSGPVRRALQQLKSEGLILARKGRGAFVRRPLPIYRYESSPNIRGRRPPGVKPLDPEGEATGFTRVVELLEIAVVPAPAPVAEQLDLAEQTHVLVRRHKLQRDD